ncbi:MAG: hypothetical protein H0X16_08940 [Chloroflexi bacterium]|nr:hypothetical protein [Chloroflexota bacterium]
MRKVLLAFVTTLALLLTMPFAAAAHEGTPCPTSHYGAGHVAGLATKGGIGAPDTAHNPGMHFGYAGLCLVNPALPDVHP